MKRTFAALAAAASFLLPAVAQAAIIPTLTSVVDNGNGTFTWTYGGTLASDQALTTGDRLVIYDFLGYVPNSVFVPQPQPAGFVVTPSTEDVSPEGAVLPAIGQSDDASIPNLVFTYLGPNPVNFTAPFSEVEFSGLGAISTFGGLGADGFSGNATRNQTSPNGEVVGSPTLNFGSVSVPGAVPEPGTWAMMLLGFGALGMAMRRKQAATVQARFRFA